MQKRILIAAIASFLFLAGLPAGPSPVSAHASAVGPQFGGLCVMSMITGCIAENDGDQSGKCGVERWSVKTLTDADVASVDFTPRTSTVEALRALNGGKPPLASMKSADQYANHRLEDEKHAVRVRAVLVGWKKEKDRDFHIVIAQPGHPDDTMIVEPPDPSCSMSPKAADFSAVRASFVKCFGEPGRWKTLPPMLVDLDFVLFYDVPHGQTGHAPNAIEGHPLLRVKTVSGTCPGGSK